MENTFQLDSLNLTLIDWGSEKGRYKGNIKFNNHLGNITLNLDNDTSEKILAVIADQIVESARTVSSELLLSIQQDIKRIGK